MLPENKYKVSVGEIARVFAQFRKNPEQFISAEVVPPRIAKEIVSSLEGMMSVSIRSENDFPKDFTSNDFFNLIDDEVANEQAREERRNRMNEF